MNESEIMKFFIEADEMISDFEARENEIMDKMLEENVELSVEVKRLQSLSREIYGKCEEFKEEGVTFAITKEIHANSYNFVVQRLEILKLRTNSNANLFITESKINHHEKIMEEQKRKIEYHDRNMLNIMGILLAIFSLVGINMGTFGAIKEETSIKEIITLVIIINLSLSFSMGMLFLYIKLIFNRKEK